MTAPDPPSPPARQSLVRRIAADVTPLRVSRDFRRIWLGLLVTELGFQFTLVATYYQVTELTGSAAAVGVIGLVGFVALVIGALVGGSILDAFDRRTGDLEAGLVASASTPTVSVVSGGLLCILGTAIVAWRVPAFRRYRAGDPA